MQSEFETLRSSGQPSSLVHRASFLDMLNIEGNYLPCSWKRSKYWFINCSKQGIIKVVNIRFTNMIDRSFNCWRSNS